MKIVIDGNIGSGKTTQLNILEKKGWLVRREPIDEWPLELFYSDKSRWALLLQLKILQTLQPVRNTEVYERCLFSTRYVFWQHLLQNGLVRPEEHDVYITQYQKDVWYPDVYIFLSKRPEVAYQHIQERHQSGDSVITLEYLCELDTLYKKMIMNVPCLVHIINAEQSPEAIHSQILSVLRLYESSVYITDTRWEKVQKAISYRWQMLCASFANVCCVSRTRAKSQFSWSKETYVHPRIPHTMHNDLV